MAAPKLRLISGTTHPQLSQEISDYLKVPLSQVLIKRFSDGEIYVKIDETVRGDDVFVIQPTSPPVNDSLMELLIILDALRRASVNSITVVVPYLGYARQDRKASSREPITAKLVANLITTAGAQRLLTIDLHKAQIQGFFDIPVDNLEGLSLLASYIQKKTLKDLVIVSPDIGSARVARSMGRLLEAPIAIIDKRRDANTVEVMHIVGEVEGKNALIIDDMIDTGGTILKATEALYKAGVREVYVAATHGVLSGNAVQKFTQSEIKEIVFANTVPHTQKLGPKFHVLSVSTLLGEAIQRIYERKSLSTLFDEMLSLPQKRLIQ